MTFKTKSCQRCGKTFVPSGGPAKWCPDCVPIANAAGIVRQAANALTACGQLTAGAKLRRYADELVAPRIPQIRSHE